MRRLLWLGAVAGPVAVVAAFWFRYDLPPQYRTQQVFRPECVIGVTYPTVGAFLLSRRPGLVVGRLVWTIGLFAAGYWLSIPVSRWAVVHELPGAVLLRWAAKWAYIPEFLPLIMLVPLLFPDGRVPSRRWRPVLVLAVLLVVVNTVFLMLLPGEFGFGPYRHSNPFGVDAVAGFDGFYGRVIEPLTVGTTFLAISSLAVRFKAGDEIARRQIAWIAYPLLGTAVVGYSDLLWPDIPFWAFTTLTCTAVGTVPVALAVAVLRDRLYGIDVIVNRTLVYATLTVILGLVYFGLIAAVQHFVMSPAAGFAGALAVGALFQPVRKRVQRSVDSLLGLERDPYRLADRLSRTVQRTESPTEALRLGVKTARRALALTGAAVEIDGRILHSDGVLGDNPRAIPLVWHGEPIGRLLIEARGRSDHRLLGVLTRHVADLAHTVRLLRVSQENLISTREEERRRLGRDLHDGLGPTLASLALTVDAARIRLRSDPTSVEPSLVALRERMTSAMAEIRDLVHGLRPPALDAQGLTGAVQTLAADLPRPHVTVEADPIDLPSPIEVAAYRIVQEALTNITRHAQATSAAIRMTLTDTHLELVVSDDGRGLPKAPSSGLGLISMRERTSELGGTFTLASRPGHGTVLTARLPIG
ncbi:sensor histidine kinase [Actinocorallia longicatena]|uniref:Oxygen sensor histidine kinase NreB n=1 Tax=Actinocorallia longicatena TaxID=111803 RepID=A0ABP6QGL4_9ACTN